MKMNRQESDNSRQESAETRSLVDAGSNSSRPTSPVPALAKGMHDVHGGNPRREFRWSKAARDLVRANTKASGKELSALVSSLMEESGYPRWACWKFVRRMGIRSKRPQRAWTESEQQRLQKLIDLHPINEIAKMLRRSESSVWHMLYRLGASAAVGRDGFTKNTLAVALHVSPIQVDAWINRGWLKARAVETGQIKRLVIAASDFCDFCREHTKDVVGNRLTKERLEFVYRFAFPPNHADLLAVRSAKKEEVAFETQTKSEPIRSGPPENLDQRAGTAA
jgi:hypothetical protein